MNNTRQARLTGSQLKARTDAQRIGRREMGSPQLTGDAPFLTKLD